MNTLYEHTTNNCQYVYIALKWQHVVFDVVSYLRALGDNANPFKVSSVKFGNSQFWFQNSIVSFWTKSKINKINNNDTWYIIEFVKSKIRLFFEDLKFSHNLYLMTAVPVLKKFSLVSKLLLLLFDLVRSQGCYQIHPCLSISRPVPMPSSFLSQMILSRSLLVFPSISYRIGVHLTWLLTTYYLGYMNVVTSCTTLHSRFSAKTIQHRIGWAKVHHSIKS